MADIFISYASEDREKARALAQALGRHGWIIWWDRKIPLGKSFDAVIEKALSEAKCVIVLWSAFSVASEWVRNEASEAKRREILVPVFLEPVEAPLAFRLLNGANLSDWRPGLAHTEFDKLVERITELLGQTQLAAAVDSAGSRAGSSYQQPGNSGKPFPWSRLVAAAIALFVIAVALGAYVLKSRQSNPSVTVPFQPPFGKPAGGVGAGEFGTNEIEKAVKDLATVFGGSVPASSLAKGFHVPDLGLRIAFISPEQSRSTLGSMPPGAVVLEIESDRPAGKAGLQPGDIVLEIAGRKIGGENDLRQAILKIGPGKTHFVIRRGSDTKTTVIDCPACKAG